MTEIATRPVGTYERLGVRRVINAAATLTRLGGSVMPREVRQAMLEAAESFVDVVDLQRAVSARIAELTRNESAYVTSGAAAGLALVTAALITGTDEAKAEREASLRLAECFRRANGFHKEIGRRLLKNLWDSRNAGLALLEARRRLKEQWGEKMPKGEFGRRLGRHGTPGRSVEPVSKPICGCHCWQASSGTRPLPFRGFETGSSHLAPRDVHSGRNQKAC